MFTRRLAALLLLLSLLLEAGCQTAHAPDPFSRGSSPLARLAPPAGAFPGNLAGNRRTATSVDPFLSARREEEAVGHDDQPGHATLADTTLDDPPSPAADWAAGPVASTGPQVVHAGAFATRAAATDEALTHLLYEQRQAGTLDDSTAEQRLRQLEEQLQRTDDHAAQDQLALEIARLRKQLSHRGR